VRRRRATSIVATTYAYAASGGDEETLAEDVEAPVVRDEAESR
jgi:hypothetical protein